METRCRKDRGGRAGHYDHTLIVDVVVDSATCNAMHVFVVMNTKFVSYNNDNDDDHAFHCKSATYRHTYSHFFRIPQARIDNVLFYVTHSEFCSMLSRSPINTAHTGYTVAIHQNNRKDSVLFRNWMTFTQICGFSAQTFPIVAKWECFSDNFIYIQQYYLIYIHVCVCMSLVTRHNFKSFEKDDLQSFDPLDVLSIHAMPCDAVRWGKYSRAIKNANRIPSIDYHNNSNNINHNSQFVLHLQCKFVGSGCQRRQLYHASKDTKKRWVISMSYEIPWD